MSQIAIAPTIAPAPTRHAWLRAGWSAFWRERELRAVIDAVRRLDDHTLRDIGLHRGDIAAGVRRGRNG